MTDRTSIGAATDEARLRQIIARVAKIAPDTIGLDDDVRVAAGLDSLTILRVAAGIEREFNVTIPDDRLHDLLTLRSMITFLRLSQDQIKHEDMKT